MNAAARWHQIRDSACSKALAALTTNMKAERTHANVLLTMGDYTVHMACAWARVQQSWTAPSYLISLHPDADTTTWCKEHFRTQVVHHVIDGDIKIAGFSVPSEKAPPELLEKEPEKPQLKAAVWATAAGPMKVLIPDTAINAWRSHPEFGPRFIALEQQCFSINSVWSEPDPLFVKNEDTG